MSTQDNLTIAAQVPGQKNLQPGIYETTDQVIGFEPDIGLIAITSNPSDPESPSAKTAMEILMDDMQTNIPQLKAKMSDADQAILGANCLRESLQNINEYLYEQTASQFNTTESRSVSITALQYLNGHLSFVIGFGQKCLLYKNNKLKNLSDTVSRTLGNKPNYYSEILQETMSFGDILFIAAIDDIKAMGEDFIRLTLSRFPESFDMALRQLNTKISHTGASEIPAIIVCRVNQQTGLKTSWIGKFRRR